MVVVLLVAATMVAGVWLVAVRRSRGVAAVASAVVLILGVAGVAYARATEPEGMAGIGHALVAGLLLWLAVVPAAAVLLTLVGSDLAGRRRRIRRGGPPDNP